MHSQYSISNSVSQIQLADCILQATAKRTRPSSSHRDLQPTQRPRTHRQQLTPSISSSQVFAQTIRQTQYQTLAPQALNLFNTSACTIDLTDHPISNTLLRTWLQREQDTCLFNVRLIGDLDHPDQHVGIGLADLLSHSLWAQVSYDHKDDMRTCDWTCGGPVHVAVPVRTSPDAVRKIVKALYSGKIQLGDDTEEVLSLASAMQVCARSLACPPTHPLAQPPRIKVLFDWHTCMQLCCMNTCV